MLPENRRIAIVAAHPDDETIGAGALLARLADPIIIHVTDGSARDLLDAKAYGFVTREEYAAARRAELLAALALAGIGPERTRELGLPDKEASLDLSGLARSIGAALRACGAEAVLTHAYEGGHPDHDATAFAVHTGCRLPIYEFTSYHSRDGRMEVGEFVPYDGCQVWTVCLDERTQARKRCMIDSFRTQRETLQPFGVERERFRRAPHYDFTQPPNRGRVLYDRYPWGVQSAEWLRRARETLCA